MNLETKTHFMTEIHRRLTAMFTASKHGIKSTPMDRHRLEGFMQAGVFMDIAIQQEMASVMNDVHIEIFGKTIQERKKENIVSWNEEAIDYSAFEMPAYERINRPSLKDD